MSMSTVVGQAPVQLSVHRRLCHQRQSQSALPRGLGRITLGENETAPVNFLKPMVR